MFVSVYMNKIHLNGKVKFQCCTYNLTNLQKTEWLRCNSKRNQIVIEREACTPVRN